MQQPKSNQTSEKVLQQFKSIIIKWYFCEPMVSNILIKRIKRIFKSNQTMGGHYSLNKYKINLHDRFKVHQSY